MNSVVKIAVFLMCVIVPLSSCNKNKKIIPKGWRVPVEAELRDDWRKKDITRYLIISGDFNDDGVIDEARILVREDGSGFGLFVFLSQADRIFNPYLLDEIKEMRFIHAMGIKKVSKGLYKTACGKGYWACDPDEASEILINNDAIDYFKTESANSYFYWDKETKTFKRIWISD